METIVLEHEAAIRLGIFLLMFASMASWEALAPRRAASLPRRRRWPGNLSIVVLNTLALRVLFPAAAAGMALFAEERGFGLLNHVELPLALDVVLALLVLDLAIWAQHMVFHFVPVLWRLHQVHHADLDVDVTTGARFHPLEIVLSMGVKFAVIVALGPPVLAVVLFEVVLNAMAMFTHSNVDVPLGLDRALRWLVVTPDMHRVHHSVERDETNSNFGFHLSWWDRLFRTYRADARAGQTGMTIGLPEHRDPDEAERLLGMLTMPFRAGDGQRS